MSDDNRKNGRDTAGRFAPGNPGRPAGARRAAHRGRDVGLGKEHSARRKPVHIRCADIGRVVFECAQIAVSLVVCDDDEEVGFALSLPNGWSAFGLRRQWL